jgi:predicted GIY-YIG superfamily endonuclease
MSIPLAEWPVPTGDDAVRVVYLLHLDCPWRPHSHYVGWSKDIAKRVAQHRMGASSLYTQGIGLHLARILPGAGMEVELRMKAAGGGASCPMCRSNPWPPPLVGSLRPFG